MKHNPEPPFFFAGNIQAGSGEYMLDGPNSHHAIQVLRLKAGDPIWLTDGKGTCFHGLIREPHPKKCRIEIVGTEQMVSRAWNVSIGIALPRHNSRRDWFLEKAAEIGVDEIIPLLTERELGGQFPENRLKQVLISGMLQSQQFFIPRLLPPQRLEELSSYSFPGSRFVAHCNRKDLPMLNTRLIIPQAHYQLLVGPEGDFSPREVQLLADRGFEEVSLGDTRLRTETAGVVGAALLRSRSWRN